jgi:hypothetical protein
MGAAEIVALAGTLLGGAGEVATLAAQAIAAARAGDDARALELLDQAIAKQQADVVVAQAELDAVRARVAKRIADKFKTAP